MHRQPARRLPKQHLHVPAQRQDRAPGLRERVHAQDRKSYAGIAEGRRHDEAGKPEPSRKVARQKLQQRSKRQVADDQQHAGGDHHRHIALERDLEQSLQDQRHRQHDDDEDREQGRELARQRDDRIAAGAGEPGAHAAPPELGAHCVAGGDRDDHVDHHRQQRAQQKLRVVPLRVDQHDRLGDERPDLGRRRRRAVRGRHAAGGGREAVAHARRRDAGRGQELLVIEGDDLRPALGLQVALEIGRHVHRGNGVAGFDRPRRGREVAGARDDAEAGGRGHLLDEGPRGLRSVLVDHDHAEPADHRAAEDRAQDHEGEQRHAEDQNDRHGVVQQPSQFAPGDQQEPGLGRASHSRVRQSRYALMPGRSSGTLSTG